MKHPLILGLCLLLATLFTLPLRAQVVVASHTGSTDPTTEGWTFESADPGNMSTGAINDGGTPAWFVTDNGSNLGEAGLYNATVTTEEIAAGNTFGWTLSATLRIPNADETLYGAEAVAYRDGANTWQLHFGSDSEGNTIVMLPTSFAGLPSGIEYNLGSGGYHTYDLVYDPLAGSADLYVNGGLLHSDYVGVAVGSTGVLWGSFSSFDTGTANYNAVSLTVVVPEPGSASLLGLATLGLLARRRK